MPVIDIVREVKINSSKMRLRQLGSIFDCPLEEKQKRHWKFDAPFESKSWNVGLIVGPSGAGKSTIIKQLGVTLKEFKWDPEKAVIEQFPPNQTIEDVSKACAAVGFNTIPAWMRPYHILSNGEQFRVTLARALAEQVDTEVLGIDEFTSVVDRQVAQIASFACAKHIRKSEKKMIVASCHEDIIEWLQPDWIIYPATESFDWRLVQRRPDLDVTISRIPKQAWRLFAPYHYLTAQLNNNAKCWGLWYQNKLVAFTSVIPRCFKGHKTTVSCFHRTVTLPDYQGLGLAVVLTDYVASLYKSSQQEIRRFTVHPYFVRICARNPNWKCVRRPGIIQAKGKRQAGRPVGSFVYIGAAFPETELARRIIATKI